MAAPAIIWGPSVTSPVFTLGVSGGLVPLTISLRAISVDLDDPACVEWMEPEHPKQFYKPPERELPTFKLPILSMTSEESCWLEKS